MTQSTAGTGALRIGWATRDFTPPRPVVLRGQFHARVSQSVMDPVTVTALAIECAGQQAILLSCDLVGVEAPHLARIRELLGGRLNGFDLRMLLAAATHTHSAPCLNEGTYPPQPPPVMTPTESAELFAQKCAEAAEAAWKALRPAGVSWAYGQAVVGHNRRACFFGGAAKMYGKTDDPAFECIEGYEDHGLNLLFTWDEKGGLTGVVVNLACPSQVSESNLQVTADYWCETRAELRKRFGKDLFVLGQCSPAGDQSPHLLLMKELEKSMWARKGISQRQEIALRIARGVEDVFDAAKADIRREVPFGHHVETLPLPVRMVTDEELAQAKADLARLEADTAMETTGRNSHRNRAKNVIARYENQKTATHKPMELHVLRIGDVAMATNPFELFLDYGVRMKARSAALQTFLVQLACDYSGYLPTARAVSGRSYGAEIASNWVGPEGGQALVDRTVEVIADLWE